MLYYPILYLPERRGYPERQRAGCPRTGRRDYPGRAPTSPLTGAEGASQAGLGSLGPHGHNPEQSPGET